MSELIMFSSVGAALVAALMLLLWLVHLRTGNAAIVDVGWAGGLVLLAILYAALGGGNPLRAGLMLGMVAVWGFRLAVHLLADRVIGQPEEGRYRELRRQWKTNIEFKFLFFFECQAILCVILAVPFLLASRDTSPNVSASEWAAVGLWLASICGEALADAQLERFKSNPANKGRTCQEGLWHYSRHPNYFFEWMIWVAYALFAIGSPGGAWALISPALILFFLTRLTGIPPTEAQALRTRGDEYRRYQQTTSVFVPWFPKQLPAEIAARRA